MTKIPQRRYVKFEFFGYAPIDLAIQLHLLGKKTDVNIVGEDMQPYLEYNGKYDRLHKPEVDSSQPLHTWVSRLKFYERKRIIRNDC